MFEQLRTETSGLIKVPYTRNSNGEKGFTKRDDAEIKDAGM